MRSSTIEEIRNGFPLFLLAGGGLMSSIIFTFFPNPSFGKGGAYVGENTIYMLAGYALQEGGKANCCAI